MYGFSYRRAATVSEAVAALRASVDGKFLAGGMSLIPVLKQRLAMPTDLIDLTGIPDLASIRREGNNCLPQSGGEMWCFRSHIP